MEEVFQQFATLPYHRRLASLFTRSTAAAGKGKGCSRSEGDVVVEMKGMEDISIEVVQV